MGSAGGAAPGQHVQAGGGGIGSASTLYGGKWTSTGTTTTSSGGRNLEDSTKNALPILRLVLRTSSLVLALIAVVLIASTEGERYYADYATSYSFYTYKSLRTRPSKFIVALSGIVILYELVLIVLGCLESRVNFRNRTSTFIVFGLDQVFAYLMFAAATAGATYSALERYGDGTVEANCTRGFMWYEYCTREAAAVSMAYLSFAALAVLALISASNYFKHNNR